MKKILAVGLSRDEATFFSFGIRKKPPTEGAFQVSEAAAKIIKNILGLAQALADNDFKGVFDFAGKLGITANGIKGKAEALGRIQDRSLPAFISLRSALVEEVNGLKVYPTHLGDFNSVVPSYEKGMVEAFRDPDVTHYGPG